jgi:hypothetical protein
VVQHHILFTACGVIVHLLGCRSLFLRGLHAAARFEADIESSQSCGASTAVCVRKRLDRSTRVMVAPIRLTNRCSQPLAVAMRRFDFMKQLLMLRRLGPASGG